MLFFHILAGFPFFYLIFNFQLSIKSIVYRMSKAWTANRAINGWNINITDVFP